MLGRRPGKKNAQAKGRGAAAAKELGLFVEFNPEEMMLGVPDDADDGDLEAELAALTGVKPASKVKPKGKAPLPMDHIEKMAQDCMRDSDGENDDDEDLEDDEDLLAELQEVVGEEDEEEEGAVSQSDSQEAAEEQSSAEPEEPLISTAADPQNNAQASSGGILQIIEERINNYKTAIIIAKQANESAKVRRYERGLKTLESMLSMVSKGRPVTQDEIPPPVATAVSTQGPPLTDITQDDLDQAPVPSSAIQDDEMAASESGATTSETGGTGAGEAERSRILLLTRQKEYKLAALRAKQSGDVEKAKEYMKMSKKFSSAIEALESGHPVDLSDVPPALDDNEQNIAAPSAPTRMASLSAHESGAATTQAPVSVLQALQQRMERYKAASQHAKGSGDERKARMHERIVKQYQDAIRGHKAGRQVNLAELPVPPGFPPLPGMESTEGQGSMEQMLEAAHKLATTTEGDQEVEPAAKKPTQLVKPLTVREEAPVVPNSGISPDKAVSPDQLSPAAQEQIELLENRRIEYRKAALQAKQRNDLEQAKQHMRAAHALQISIDQLKSGQLVDITKLLSRQEEDESSDFVLIDHEDVKPPQNTEDVYAQLLKLLQEQYEKCLCYSKQFTQMGNVAETTRFEKMAQDCKKNCEILHLSQAQGLDPPPYHFEDKTLKIVRIFSELSSTEMLLIIVRGINLPAPSGIAPNDLDAFVKFDFPYPSTEQPQKNKTSVIKNTNSPEYEQSFKLNINRNHRGFKRIVQTKGIKFEIFHKGMFLLRSDKQIGTASVKLDRLETQCEIHEIVEVFDGRKPTGGKLEVKVRLREPLNGQDIQTVTEKWLTMGQHPRKMC